MIAARSTVLRQTVLTRRRPVVCSSGYSQGPLPPSGTVGEDRFKELKVPGTYWWREANIEGVNLKVTFETGDGVIETRARGGDNVLRAAEACGAIKPNLDFCLEGTCELCLVEGKGLKETSWKAESSGKDVVRSCLAPFPKGVEEVHVKVLSDEDVWNEGVV